MESSCHCTCIQWNHWICVLAGTCLYPCGRSHPCKVAPSMLAPSITLSHPTMSPPQSRPCQRRRRVLSLDLSIVKFVRGSLMYAVKLIQLNYLDNLAIVEQWLNSLTDSLGLPNGSAASRRNYTRRARFRYQTQACPTEF